ncbi:SIR2 family protein [Mucilaginibacter sp. AW1-7]|uniref:SIR2 family protein n=1 Tax=Mucilaginibacter sp. AW1-7 TaxID=3349874 RepID=UPI003F73FA3F
MDHILDDNEDLRRYLHDDLFPSIKKGDVTLFLGAGASVTEMQFLGRSLIDYYEDKLGVSLGISDLIEFTDIISANPKFNREDFDNYIVSVLNKLTPTESHKIIAGANWNQIITTNVDLILERAFDEIENTTHENRKVKVVRNVSETHTQLTNSHIRYTKLNGCISNKNKYPLVFSSKDFLSSKKFYNATLKPLSDLPPDAKFMTIGYSFTDHVSNYILKYFDSFNYRYKKPIICFDPFIQLGRLDFLKEQGIFVIKQDVQTLLEKYKIWEEENAATIVSRKSIAFKNINNESISLPSKLKLALGNNIIQLSDTSRLPAANPVQFYQGERPSYDIVRKNIDVVKSGKLDTVKREVLDLINKNHEKIVPVIFLTGSFGTGKSTFAYRLLHSLTTDATISCVAFEFQDLSLLRPQDIGELFSLTFAKLIFITYSEIEIDSSFKELMDFRNKVSIEQFSMFNIYFIVSIRENILTRFFKNYQYKNTHIINVDSKINNIEATELVSKLDQLNLVHFRDVSEKKKIVNQITSDFGGDTFISLISLITNNSFEDIILSAYHQLSKTAKDAFLYTSILYQYKLLMPSGLLMRLVSKNWTDFDNEVLKYDSKGIIIQEYLDTALTPDLYFRTRHSIISQHLIKKILKTQDQLNDKIKRVVENLVDNDFNAQLFVNLIKAIRDDHVLSHEKINRLFDIADKIFESNPHFVLYYAINLQLRKNMSAIKKGIEKIRFAEGFLDYRNSKLIHRRAVLHYELAKLYFDQNNYPNTIVNIEEARELFEIKRLDDPGSSFSYIDYINLELWVLNNIDSERNDLLLLHIKIQELLDWAVNAVYENVDRIFKLKYKYYKHLETAASPSNTSMQEYLDELYESEETRPYSLVLKYNYLQEKEKTNESIKLIAELESLTHNDEVAKLLFKYYGRNLNVFDNRSKFFKLVKGGYDFRKYETLRYYFYSYIAESYNRNFNYADENVQNIFSMDTSFNPDLHELWIEEDGSQSIFTGLIFNTQRGFTNLKVSELQLRCRLMKESYLKFHPKAGDQFKIKLHFFIKGIRAELIEKIES